MMMMMILMMVMMMMKRYDGKFDGNIYRYDGNDGVDGGDDNLSLIPILRCRRTYGCEFRELLFSVEKKGHRKEYVIGKGQFCMRERYIWMYMY